MDRELETRPSSILWVDGAHAKQCVHNLKAGGSRQQ